MKLSGIRVPHRKHTADNIPQRLPLPETVVIPMSMFVIKAREYEMELIGVVPRRDTIEKATPIAIKNKPQTKANILFIISSLHFL